MNRRRVLLNCALALALVGAGAVAVATLSNAGTEPTLTGRTAPVARGTLTQTVTASGNVQSATSVAVQLNGSGGTVTAVYVLEGQHVTKGQQLLKIDDRAARRSLATAEASLESAQASLTTAVQKRSASDMKVDNAAIRSAKTALANAKTSRSAAKASYAQDKVQQRALVSSAEDDLSAACSQQDDDEKSLAIANDQTPRDQTKITSLESTVRTDASATRSAEKALTQAKQTRDATWLKDRQAIDSADGSVNAAEDSLASQRASAAANQQAPRAGAVDSAQAQVDSAEVTVREAKQTLADTVLRAPSAGTIATINAVKGQSSTSAGTSSGSTSTGSGSSGAAAGSSASSTASGLVTLADLSSKEVLASVAEADTIKVKVGQLVSVLFTASGQAARGTVSAIDTVSTVSNNVVEYGVTVTLTSDATNIRLGQTATVTITTATRTNVLSVPTSAVTTTAGRATVTRRSNNTDTTVDVRTGLVGTTGTEITAGLAEGDQVVLPTGGSGSLTFPGGGRGGSGSAASATPAPSDNPSTRAGTGASASSSSSR